MNYFFIVLKNYVNFNGRARRSELWYFILFSTIISTILRFVDASIGGRLLQNIYGFAVLLPTIAVWVRRMHDIDKSGWFCIIPFYNIYLGCIDGTSGDNEYGPDPKGRGGFGAEDYQKPFDINP